MEPSQTTPDHPAALAEPGGTLVEPWWRTLVEPYLKPDHPAALAEFGGTLAEVPQTTLAEPGKTLVEPGRSFV